MNYSKYLKEAISIQELIINKFTDENNHLPIRIDSETGETIDDRSMVNDLGDFVQYSYLTGKLTNIEEYMQFALDSSFSAASSHQLSTGLFKGVYTNNNQLEWYNLEDTFYGFTSLYYLSGNGDILEILDRFKVGIEMHMHSSGFLHGATLGLNKYIARTPITFVEGLAHMNLRSGQVEYLDLAKKLARPWIKSEFFQRFGLFPERYSESQMIGNLNYVTRGKIFGRLKGLTGSCSILKGNSNFMQGILELWKLTNEKIYLTSISKWIGSVETLANQNDRYGNVNVFTKECSYFNKPMFQTIHILGFYADLCAIAPNSSVKHLLDKSLNRIVQNQTDIGFFRVEPEITSSEKYRMGWLDQQTDISVILLKGYIISGKEKYLKSVIKCIDAIIFYLKRPFGFLEYFDPETGENTFHSKLYTKFLTLLPKAFILLDAVQKKQNIFHGDLFLISGDR